MPQINCRTCKTKFSLTGLEMKNWSCPVCRLTALLTNDYCDLHKSPQEGEGCPVCLGVDRREAIIARWAKDRKRLTKLLTEYREMATEVYENDVSNIFWEGNNYQLILKDLAKEE